MNKKWEIKKIKNSKKLKSIADIILEQRINRLIDLIKIYLKDKTIENLHDVRIALRRVRYNLELFLVCYDQATFSKFYKKIENLQNLSGEVRDFDVMLMNLEKLKQSSVTINEAIKENIIKKRNEIEINLINNLTRFLKSKSLREFQKEIK